jgi:hypothetical protein
MALSPFRQINKYSTLVCLILSKLFQFVNQQQSNAESFSGNNSTAVCQTNIADAKRSRGIKHGNENGAKEWKNYGEEEQQGS